MLPTRLPLPEFYAELVRTQQVLNRKHMGWSALRGATGEAARLLLQGQTNFVRMLWLPFSTRDCSWPFMRGRYTTRCPRRLV